jgi:ketosteroid isomerase-like protein
MAEESEQVVRAYLEAVNADEASAPDTLFTDDFEMIEAPSLPGAAHIRGRAALERYFRGWRRNWTEWRWTPVLVEADGAVVLVQADLWLRASHTGIAVERRWWYVFTVRDGRLARQEGFDTDDEAGARAALAAAR